MTFKTKSAKSTVTPLLTLGGKNVKSVNHCKHLGIVLDTELSDDKGIQRQLRYQYCTANNLRASFSRCSNAVKNVLFRSFCTPVFASQLCCNFRKSCVQKLRVAYSFGCRALYNISWRASVSSHHGQCNIPTFEALLRKNMHLFLERCRKSNNIWLRALMQSDCVYSSLYFEHYNRILLCDWVLRYCSFCSFERVSCHNAFVLMWPNEGFIKLIRRVRSERSSDIQWMKQHVRCQPNNDFWTRLEAQRTNATSQTISVRQTINGAQQKCTCARDNTRQQNNAK